MKIQGVEISEAQEAGALTFMRSGAMFKAADVESAFIRLGVQNVDGVPMRAADRLIQRERKAGRIKLVKTAWWQAVKD